MGHNLMVEYPAYMHETLGLATSMPLLTEKNTWEVVGILLFFSPLFEAKIFCILGRILTM